MRKNSRPKLLRTRLRSHPDRELIPLPHRVISDEIDLPFPQSSIPGPFLQNAPRQSMRAKQARLICRRCVRLETLRPPCRDQLWRQFAGSLDVANELHRLSFLPLRGLLQDARRTQSDEDVVVRMVKFTRRSIQILSIKSTLNPMIQIYQIKRVENHADKTNQNQFSSQHFIPLQAQNHKDVHDL